MSEDYLIQHCAPTLAGIKTANLFTCPCQDREALLSFLRQTNRKLLSRGIRILPLRFYEGKALIYLYRPRKLTADLADSAAADILRRKGYCQGSCEQCISQLVRRMHQQQDFPHEIGLFLGYPPEDVCGFIENKASNCKCVGCWKVYGDEAAARKKFALYKKCTRIYNDRWANGTNIERLTVAG